MVHHNVRVPNQVQWLVFVCRQCKTFTVIDLPTLLVARELPGCHWWCALRYGAEPYRCLAGYSVHTPLSSVH